jgi:hypothetical protein
LRGIAERKLRLRRFYTILLGKDSYTFKGIAENNMCCKKFTFICRRYIAMKYESI